MEPLHYLLCDPGPCDCGPEHVRDVGALAGTLSAPVASAASLSPVASAASLSPVASAASAASAEARPTSPRPAPGTRRPPRRAPETNPLAAPRLGTAAARARALGSPPPGRTPARARSARHHACREEMGG